MPSPSQTILLVEDQILLASVEQLMLQSHGYEVILAHTAKEAIALADQTPNLDLILMDIDLGVGIDGIETARQILEKHNVALLFLSSHKEKEVLEKTEQVVNSYGFVFKDSGDAVLAASIKKAIAHFRSNQELLSLNKRLAESDVEGLHFLEQIINSIGTPLFIKDSEHKFVKVNQALGSMLGQPADQLIGKTGYEFLPPEQMEVFIAKDKEVLASGIENINEEEITDSAGNLRAIITHKTLYTDTLGRKFLVCVISDITEQKRIENDLIESKALYQSLIENPAIK